MSDHPSRPIRTPRRARASRPSAVHLGVLVALLAPAAVLIARSAQAGDATNPAMTTRYVATTGINSGACTVEADPCKTISYAVTQSSSDDVIEIASGVYTESFAIDKSLSLHGADETTTIIQANEQPGVATSRVITIDGGFVVDISDVTVRHGAPAGTLFPEGEGGGILSSNGTLNLTNVTLSDNTAHEGGGIATFSGHPTLTHVTFSGNNGDVGGGMHNRGNSPVLTHVVFDGNLAVNWGGGMHNQSSSPTLTDVVFSDNTASARGGAMYNDASSPTLGNVVFSGNQSNYGGGMANFGGSSPKLANAVFSGNIATGFFGGGIYNQGASSPTLTNVSFSGNAAAQSGGALFNFDRSSPTLVNVIIWNNRKGSSTTSTAASIANYDGSSQPTISYSLIANSGGSAGWVAAMGVDGGNNLDADPLFVDTPDPNAAPSSAGDVRLQSFSPAIDVGDPATDLSLFPGGPDNPVDLDGHPRIVCYSIDIGAYESTKGGSANCDVLFRDGFEHR